MKTKTFLLLCLFFGIGITQLSGQILQKGAVVAVSNYEFLLKPDVSLNQFIDFYTNKYIPEFEKDFPGIKEYVMWGDRGEYKNKIGGILVFESVAVRDKYYPRENDTIMSDAFNAANAKMNASGINTELMKYVLSGTRKTYTDFILK